MILKTVSIYLLDGCSLKEEIDLSSPTQTCKVLRPQDAYTAVKDAIRMFAIHFIDLEQRCSKNLPDKIKELTYEERVERETHEIFSSLQKESGTGTWAIITNKETKSEEDLRQYYDSRSKKIDHEQFSRLMTFNQKTEFSGSFFDEKDVLTLTSILLSISEVRSITRLRQSKFLFDEISQNPIYIYSSSFNFDSYSIYPITESEVLGVRAKLEMRGTKSISSSFRFFLESRQHRIDNFKSFLFAFLALEELGKQSYTKGWKISGGKTQGYAHMFRQLVCSQSLEEEHKVFLSDHKIVDGVFWKEDHKLEETWYKKKAGERGDQGFFKISSPRTRIGIMMLILNNEEFEKFQTDFLVFKNLNRVRNNLVHQNLFQPKNENCQSISRLFMDYARRHVDFLGKYDES